jgi:hypothetical protein
MKYVIALISGLAAGAVLFVAGAIYNPFLGNKALSPIAVTNAKTVTLSYSGVPSEGILYTNDGESRTKPYPEKVLQLWEEPIGQTFAMATVLRDGRNQTAGLGIKISSASESTRLLMGRALTNSIWYVYLPGKGGFFVEQSENYWDYLREIVVPRYHGSGDTWAGSWLGNMTFGPGALGTAIVSGGTGEFEAREMLGVESLSVKAWRADHGVVAAEGRLIIEMLSEETLEVDADDETDAPL